MMAYFIILKWNQDKQTLYCKSCYAAKIKTFMNYSHAMTHEELRHNIMDIDYFLDQIRIENPPFNFDHEDA